MGDYSFLSFNLADESVVVRNNTVKTGSMNYKAEAVLQYAGLVPVDPTGKTHKPVMYQNADDIPLRLVLDYANMALPQLVTNLKMQNCLDISDVGTDGSTNTTDPDYILWHNFEKAVVQDLTRNSSLNSCVDAESHCDDI